MRKTLGTLVLSIGLVALTAGADDSIPGRNGNYEFEGESLEGTVWSGRLLPDDDSIFRFEKGGVLWIRYFGNASRMGTWKQDGSSIYIEVNQKYAEMRGILRGGRMTGDGGNRANLKWTFDVQRKSSSIAAPYDSGPNLKEGVKEKDRLKEERIK
jgi:hypothetical protein